MPPKFLDSEYILEKKHLNADPYIFMTNNAGNRHFPAFLKTLHYFFLVSSVKVNGENTFTGYFLNIVVMSISMLDATQIP